MREDAVTEALGGPFKEYETLDAPTPYYVVGYAHPNREIKHKVLIYIRGEWICYVFIDETGSVEDVFIGGS